MNCARHVVLIGLNFHHRRKTGDKNFWVELIPEIAPRLDRLTIISVRAEAEPEHLEKIAGCPVAVRYLPPRLLGHINNASERRPWQRVVFPAFLGIIEKALTARLILVELALLHSRIPFRHIHFMENFGIANNRIAAWAIRQGISVSVSAITYMGKHPLFYHPYLRASFSNRGITVVPYSIAHAEKLEELGIHPGRICHIPWGVRTDKRPDSSKVPDVTVFLWAGYIQQIGEQDFHFAMRQAKKAISDGLSAHFVFAFKPESWKPEYELLARGTPQICIMETTNERFHELMQQASVLFSPIGNRRSIVTPPLTWIEMLNLGKPVLSMKVRGVDAVIQDGETGYACGDEGEVSSKMRLLTTRARDMSSNCRRLVEKNYNVALIARKYLDLWLREREGINVSG